MPQPEDREHDLGAFHVMRIPEAPEDPPPFFVVELDETRISLAQTFSDRAMTPIEIAGFSSTALFFVLWVIALSKAKKALSAAEIADRKALEALTAANIKSAEAEAALQGEIHGLKEKFSRILSVEEEVERLTKEARETELRIKRVQITYAEKRKYLEELEAQIAIFDERLAFAEMGVYEPHFEFNDSEEFKEAILRVREDLKAVISAKTATRCPTEWSVEGSKSKGQTMINRQTRITLRAFNAECDAAISNIRWNNAVAMEKRIRSAAEAINRENASLNLTITDKYINLKVKELRLTHEYREKQKQEREERAELVRAEREEKKLLAEAEAAEREERRYQALLDKAKADAESAAGGISSAMAQRIAELEIALAEAHDASERARAMAEMTKSGYVYIISNVGSFGEDVVKIGLTRRLDPDDRVRELGDASVPFGFDVHAMIYSDEAPALENALHREFADRRINMTNFRKEFFRVGLDEVEDAVKRLAPSASFFKDREAQEWHETLARRNQALKDMAQPPSALLPAEI